MSKRKQWKYAKIATKRRHCILCHKSLTKDEAMLCKICHKEAINEVHHEHH